MVVDSGILQRVRRSLHTLRRSGVPVGPDAPPVIAAFSGGADSLALVVMLRELERLGLARAIAVHVDHGVRPESGDEARAVASVADRLGVAFRAEQIAPDALTRHVGSGLEEAMRRERYRLLAGVAAEEGAEAIATGHHRRDQAETVLLHLMRGAGLGGAAGMREVSALVVPWWQEPGPSIPVTLWRPLLREDPVLLRGAIAPLGLPVVEDPTNRSEVFRRSALRHRALPILESIVPGAETNLAAFADRAAEDADALDAIAQEVLAARPDRDRLPRSLLEGQPVAIRQRVIRGWVTAVAPGVDLTADRTEAIRGLGERNEGGKTVQIGGGWSVRLVRGDLRAVPPAGVDAT